MQLAVYYEWLHQSLTVHPVLAPFLYILAHMVFAVCCIPCSPMAVIAGALWGKWLGLIFSIFAAFFSSCTTFWLSRWLLKDRIYRFLSKRYTKVDWFLAQTQKHGWKFVASVQLNPAAPGSTLGYLFGLTGIRFSVYAFFLIVFMLPLQWLLVYFGDSCSSSLLGTTSWMMALLMLILTMAYIFYQRFYQKGGSDNAS